jgi:methylated-DNA-[protein]-cysteine S-methyltransferase
MKMLRNYTIK